MPTQAKKTVSTPHNEKTTKLRKKKRKDSAKKTSRKDSQTGSDSTAEEHIKKSKAKVIAFGRACVSSDSYPSPSSRENGFTSSCLASSTDGRSTSSQSGSSGENIEISFPTTSSDTECNRKDDDKETFTNSAMNTRTIRNESLRWEGQLDDVEEEQDRLRVYKMNRRKRYMASLQTNEEDSCGQFYA